MTSSSLRLLRICAAAAIGLFLAAGARAVTLPYSENFDSTTATRLFGVTGWAGNNNAQYLIQAGSVTDSGYSSSSGKLVNVVNSSTASSDFLAVTSTSGDIYASFYLYVNAANTTDD